jgi:hypothetical protein
VRTASGKCSEPWVVCDTISDLCPQTTYSPYSSPNVTNSTGRLKLSKGQPQSENVLPTVVVTLRLALLQHENPNGLAGPLLKEKPQPNERRQRG